VKNLVSKFAFKWVSRYTEVGSSLRFHYPTLTQRGCQLYVAYSRRGCTS
jgi:hypothetical protein